VGALFNSEYKATHQQKHEFAGMRGSKVRNKVWWKLQLTFITVAETETWPVR